VGTVRPHGDAPPCSAESGLGPTRAPEGRSRRRVRRDRDRRRRWQRRVVAHGSLGRVRRRLLDLELRRPARRRRHERLGDDAFGLAARDDARDHEHERTCEFAPHERAR
jgi:hypothetical protein